MKVKVTKAIAAVALAVALQVPALAIPQRDQTILSGIAKEMFAKDTLSVRGQKKRPQERRQTIGAVFGYSCHSV